MRNKTFILALSAATVVGALAVAPAASAAPCVESSRVWINIGTGGSGLAVELELLEYSVDDNDELTLESRVPVPGEYGDIAVTPDGLTMYAVDFRTAFQGDPVPVTRLVTINLATDDELTSVVIRDSVTGLFHPDHQANALAVAPDGSLYLGTYFSSTVWKVDPLTGVKVPFFELPLVPGELVRTMTSAGDFITLPGGDLLMSADDGLGPGFGANSWLLRFDMQSVPPVPTVIGTVTTTWGLAAVDRGRVFSATAYIQTMHQLDLPLPTEEGFDPLAITTKVVLPNNTDIYGATGQADSGPCVSPEQDPEPELLADTGAASSSSAMAGLAALMVLGGMVLIARRSRSLATASR